MARFLSHLDTRAHKDNEFVLLDDFGFEFHLPGYDKYQMWVPRGFITDFASVPWLVQALPGFDVNGASRFAAVVHDWLYCNNGLVPMYRVNKLTGLSRVMIDVQFDRSQADEIFRIALLATGSDAFTKPLVEERFTETQARVYWLGVRSGGWYYWNKRKDGIRIGYDFMPLKELHDMENAA